MFLEAVLRPYRSLPPRGFAVLMTGLAAVSLVAGVTSVLVGAWPVIGFFGLDVALVYLAFRLSYRSARLRECVRLTERSLTVERISAGGQRKHWQFQPFWLRVVLRETAETSTLTLASHGRALVVGGFLAPEARRNFAAALREALARLRECRTGTGRVD